MEIEHIENNDPEQDYVSFTINDGESDEVSIPLTKKDVFKLIGALHLLHKEMK